MQHQRSAITLLILAAGVTPAVARAQGSAVADAEALFRLGHQLYEEKRYVEACPKFQESFRLDPATGSLLALAACHEAEGKLASAWAEYNETAARARKDGRTDRADAAQQRVAVLEPKLARVTIVLAPGAAEIPGLVVKRDGVLLGPGAYGAPLPVDRGQHTIEASAPGYEPWAGRGALADGASESVTIPRLTELPRGAAAAKPEGAVAKSDGPPLRAIGIATGIGGLVAIGIGSYFGLHAISKNNESTENGNCVVDACSNAGTLVRRDAISAGNTSTVLFVVGGALVAGGVALFLLGGPRSAGETKPAVAASPAVGPHGGGVVLGGRF